MSLPSTQVAFIDSHIPYIPQTLICIKMLLLGVTVEPVPRYTQVCSRKPEPVLNERPMKCSVDQWEARIWNIDDSGSVRVNSKAVLSLAFGHRDTGYVSINKYLMYGNNTIRFQASTAFGSYTYHFALRKNNGLVYNISHVWRGDIRLNQVVYRHTEYISYLPACDT
ncbi:unnamed protein product, partial [Didymodactylos carnosus]